MKIIDCTPMLELPLLLPVWPLQAPAETAAPARASIESDETRRRFMVTPRPML
jgi:hypothetical protein